MITNAFTKELVELLNKHSIDNLCNIPDYLLAEHLSQYINNLQKTLRMAKIQETEK